MTYALDVLLTATCPHDGTTSTLTAAGCRSPYAFARAYAAVETLLCDHPGAHTCRWEPIEPGDAPKSVLSHQPKPLGRGGRRSASMADGGS